MKRSDFWLCGEEKWSETRLRKIRAGGKLKDLFDRVHNSLGDCSFFTKISSFFLLSQKSLIFNIFLSDIYLLINYN